MKTLSMIYPVGLLLGIGFGVGCTNLLASHCANLQGDQTCAEQGGGYCNSCVTAADGCTDVMPSDDCYFSGPGEGSSTSDTHDTTDATSNSGVTTEVSTLDSGSDSDATTGAQPCGDDGCGGATPVCGMDGACVQCTADAPDACSGKTPVCDNANNVCICTEHDQCGDAACNFYTGACLPAEAVVHVGSSEGMDFTDIAAAVDSFGMGEEGTIVVHEGDYQDDVIVDGGRTLAFLAAPDGAIPTWVDEDMAVSPHLLVTGKGSTALVDSIIFSENNGSTALRITEGRAWVDRSRIVNNNGGGILVENGADLTLRNSFVNNGVSSADPIAVDNASAHVLYTTIGTLGNAFPISCSGAVNVSIRNSLLVSLDDAVAGISCFMADVTNSASNAFIPGAENFNLGNTVPEWFVDFDEGDFHLNAPLAGLSTTALWVNGDPSIDIDGEARYTDGMHGYAGADILIQ